MAGKVKEVHKRACLISIPHTGTQFTAQLFRDIGWETLGPNDRPWRETLFVAHMLKETQMARVEALAAEMPLILPLRHPFVVEEAWRRRSRPVAEMISCFRTFRDRFWPLASYVMPVDSHRRGDCLAEMADGLGLPFETDWPVVNGREGTHALRWPDCDPSPAVQELIPELRPILERFY